MARLYTVRIVAYQVMSNHFHLLLQVPAEPPSEEETARRFAAFHGGRRKLCPGTKACRQWQARLRDVSWCMRHIQHLYSAWYNRSRPVRRRGPLWAGRFKNTVLEDGAALWACWSYIECNPVRAGLVADAADYRFCSYGTDGDRQTAPWNSACARSPNCSSINSAGRCAANPANPSTWTSGTSRPDRRRPDRSDP